MVEFVTFSLSSFRLSSWHLDWVRDIFWRACVSWHMHIVTHHTCVIQTCLWHLWLIHECSWHVTYNSFTSVRDIWCMTHPHFFVTHLVWRIQKCSWHIWLIHECSWHITHGSFISWHIHIYMIYDAWCSIRTPYRYRDVCARVPWLMTWHMHIGKGVLTHLLNKRVHTPFTHAHTHRGY